MTIVKGGFITCNVCGLVLHPANPTITELGDGYCATHNEGSFAQKLIKALREDTTQ